MRKDAPAIEVPLYQDSLVLNLSADCFVDAGLNQDGINLEEYPRKADTETTTVRAPAESSSHHVTSPTFGYLIQNTTGAFRTLKSTVCMTGIAISARLPRR